MLTSTPLAQREPTAGNREAILEARVTALRLVSEQLVSVCDMAGSVEVRLLGARSDGESESEGDAPTPCDLVGQLADLTRAIRKQVGYIDESLTRVQNELGSIGT